MSTTAHYMQSMSSTPCPALVDTGLSTSDDGAKPRTASEKPAVAVEGGPAKNPSKADDQILNDREEIPISQERNKDTDSRFWTTYDKVSTEYDDDFLERANGDMGIILTFAGLFSAVNSTFIVAMQPNPGDTTNGLLLRLIQITADPNGVHDISGLSSLTEYPSSTIWMQTLAYASLAFSVLAAFGAVMGKQWLNSYKAARGRGSLEERCIQRQRKLDGLEYFHLQTVLQAFLILLQISLLLFGLSLSANVWTQQTTMSSVVISTTAFGILIYASTILVSMLHPDSPFQTPGAELLGAICKRFLAICDHFLPDRWDRSDRSTLTPDGTSIKLSAIRWILETSTNPEVVEAAAAMVPLVQWPREFDASAICARLRDNFEACRDREEVFVKCGKAMAHLWSQSLKLSYDLRWRYFYTENGWGGKSRFIRDAFMDGRNAFKQLTNTQGKADEQKHRADARTALRTMVVHGDFYRFSLPDDEDLIWGGDLRWCHSNGLVPNCEEFDWLIDYLADEAGKKGDDETEGDALLALTAMRGLGSSTKRRSYITTLIRCMGSARPQRVRHAALRAISDAREELASITHESMPQGVDGTLLDELSCAVLTVVRPNHDQTVLCSLPDTSFHYFRECCYTRLIFALAMNDEWRERLARDGHLERCTSLVERALRPWSCVLRCYLAGTFARINLSDQILPLIPDRERWQSLVRTSWGEEFKSILPQDITVVPDVVTVTRQYLRGWDNNVPNDGLTDLARDVHVALESLQSRQEIFVTSHLIPQADFDAALSSMQDLDDDLRRMIENPSTSQRDDDDGSLGS